MALSANQKEEAYIQAFIKTLKDLAKNGDQLNGVQLKGVEGMTKWMTQMSNTNTETKANLKIEKDKFTLGKKELEVRERLKKSDEHLVELRHKLNIEQEREHGDQVRRNINLRHNMDSFNDKFDMLKKSLGGGFGFQAAMDKTVKNMGGMTRTFNENKIAGEQYKKAQKESAAALTKMGIAFLSKDPVEMEEAKQELGIAKKAETRSKINVENTQKDADKAGVSGRLKPMFAKLDKMGEFLGKKAVPIGIGMGVAGVLMSVIVKAFSASPLFGAMMKLMKFMVTLILMPIGTFFGALLRPILIMLLRKFIIPFYSTAMPTLMNLGTEVGNAIVDFMDDPWKAIWGDKEDLTNIGDGDADGDGSNRDSDLDDPSQNQASAFMPIPGSGNIIEEFFDWLNGGKKPEPGELEEEAQGWFDADASEFIGAPAPDDYDPNAGYADGKFQPKDGGTYDPYAEENQKYGDSSKVDPNDITGVMGSIDYAMNKEQLDAQAAIEEEWNQKQLQAEDQLKLDAQLAAIKEEAAEAEKQWHIENAAKMAAEREAKAEAEAKKQAAIDQKAAADARAAATDKRLKEALAKMEMERIEEIREAQMLRNAQQEQVDQVNSRFTGTAKEGLLSSSQNRDMDVGAAMEKNASKGHHLDKLSSTNMNLSQATRDLLAKMASGNDGRGDVKQHTIRAAKGFDGMVNKPTEFLAGEAGAEHVKITPNGQGGGSNITVNIQNMNAGDDDLRKLKKTILEVIQQSSANRGRL